jgi:hypothetical protein
MLERIRWWLASVFASSALGLMRPETSEDGFAIALANAEKQAQWRERREQQFRARSKDGCGSPPAPRGLLHGLKLLAK